MARSHNNHLIDRKPIASHQGRHLLSETKSNSHRHEDQGFSIVYVLTAALIVVAGTSTLLNQSTSSMLGSIFQGQSLHARNVARGGMVYLISQINKEENRHLLVLPKSAEETNPDAATSLWTDIQAATNHLNPCTKTYVNGLKTNQSSPNLSDLNLGGSRVNNGYFYIADDGAISKIRNGSTRAFRIVSRPNSKDFKISLKSASTLSLLDDTQNSGVFRLSVEAVIYRNSQSNEIASSTILQEDFGVVPKCCKIPFGSHQASVSNSLKGHGNSNYALISRTNLRSNRCLMLEGLDPEGFGIVVVGNEEIGGSILAGGSRILNSRLAAVNPVYCVSAKSDQCTSADNTSGNQMERIDINLPSLPAYPGSFNGTPPVLKPCTILPCPPLLSRETSIPPPLSPLSTPRTIFDATSLGPLPDNCTLHKNDVHCIYSGIDLSGSPDDLVFVSGSSSRRIRLYFPPNGIGINQTLASGTIRHCKDRSCLSFAGNVTDLSLFGSGIQNLIIKGSPNEARMFIYAPKSTVRLIGGSGSTTFQSVIWANRLDISGTSAKLNMPRTGVADVFVLMGILPDGSNTFNNSLGGHSYTDLFPWDMVARSSNRYRFFGN